jgi:hypothetical protein
MTTERRYIVVRESDLRPMTFSGDQFCLVPPRSRSRFYLKTYTEKEAKTLISKSKRFRKKNNFFPTGYLLMPME